MAGQIDWALDAPPETRTTHRCSIEMLQKQCVMRYDEALRLLCKPSEY